MSNLDELIKSRRSIRKFTDETISDDIIKEIIESACYAPSGCNSQCWKFIAVKNKDMIKKLTDATTAGVREFYKGCKLGEDFIATRINQATFFRNAPLVICVFMTEMKYHDQRVTDFLSDKGYTKDEMRMAFGEADILSIGAAVENMLLAIHEKGLGACWMNDPVISSEHICKAFDIPDGESLISVIPVGYPAYSPRAKVLKPLGEVLTII